MKAYVRNSLFVAIFAAIAFFGGVQKADALSISLGLGYGSYTGYSTGYNSPYGYNNYYSAPVNCFNSGYPCNGYFGGNNYNNYGYGNYGYNYGSYGYGTGGCGYSCYGYTNNYPYTMSSPTYYNSGSYYDYYPARTYGSYTSSNMYSTWYGY